MSAQAQAMQAGIPFDLLTEDDLKDVGNLTGYDALVFPGFSHLAAADLVAITDALTEASEVYDVSLVAAGNFMTNDETGTPFANDSYERMKSLLGVTITSSGATDGIDLAAAAGSNPILDAYVDGETVGSYANTGYLGFSDVTGTGETLFTQTVGTGGSTSTVAGVIATETGARNVHFASDAIIGNNNILQEALDWATQDDTPGVSLALTRGESLFFARNDMDQSQEVYAVIDYDPSIYDLMLPIVENWYETYGFTGSYYINIGANAPDQLTDWTVSKPYFDQLIALEGEIGSHSYTHPENTNLLLPDQVTQDMIDERVQAYSGLVNYNVACWSPYCLREDASRAVIRTLSEMDANAINAMLAHTLARTDPNNPNAIDPTQLTEVERAVLEASYRFQFEYSNLMIEQGMGIDVTGAAVPGAPEKLETTREIIPYYEYLSGGYSAEGAGYPNAFGYLTPADMNGVYLAPNMSFDFSLVEFLGMTPAEAEAAWAAEYAALSNHATTPIYVFPWHDYGPTNFDEGGTYTVEMFESVIAQAAADGTEFVTGDDLASRIKSFAESTISLSQDGSLITATVTSTDAGKFALDVSESGTIAAVANWYAYDDTKVFLPANGGTFEITLGASQVDVTHIAALPMRADLMAVTGDGEDLAFSFTGRGNVDVALASQGGSTILITGADGGEIGAQSVTLAFDTVGSHSATIDYAASTAIAGTASNDIAIGGTGDDAIAGGAGDDLPRIDVLTLTSISEAQPLVLLEGGAAGIPCIATDVGSCREIIEGAPGETPDLGMAGFVVAPMSPQAVGDAVVKLLQDDALRRNCGAVLKRRVESRFSSDSSSRRYGDLYREAMAA